MITVEQGKDSNAAQAEFEEMDEAHLVAQVVFLLGAIDALRFVEACGGLNLYVDRVRDDAAAQLALVRLVAKHRKIDLPEFDLANG